MESGKLGTMKRFLITLSPFALFPAAYATGMMHFEDWGMVWRSSIVAWVVATIVLFTKQTIAFLGSFLRAASGKS